MSEPAEESGAQLLARLVSVCRPQINYLDTRIFPNKGPFPKEIVEISGDVGLGVDFFLFLSSMRRNDFLFVFKIGKTTLLMHVMAKVVLPLAYGGKDGMVLLLLTESCFDLEKFIGILQNHIDECKTTHATETDATTDIMTTAMQNLTIQRCFDEMHFELAIYKLDNILAESNRYCLLALDSIGAFYNTSAAQRNGHMIYMKDILTRLQRVIKDYHLALVYTKPAYFLQKSTVNRTERVNYFLELINEGDNELEDSCFVYKLDIPRMKQTFSRKYGFDVNGFIEWKE